MTITASDSIACNHRMNTISNNRKLIIELKIGPIKDEHIGQILSYEGMILSHDDPAVRVMLIGNRVPPNIQKSLEMILKIGIIF